jgi:hypothetical protein
VPESTQLDPPQVFLSFSGADRPHARRLSDALGAQGITTFLDQQNIFGTDIVLAINDALTESDYFVLLWSKRCQDHSWVAAEWAAALHRELDRRRSFLFVVRLDDHDLPPLLAPRQFLDARDFDWSATASSLISFWDRDRAVGQTVLPSPRRQGEPVPHSRGGLSHGGEGAEHGVYVRNQDLGVAHLATVPASVTGEELYRLIHRELALEGEVTALSGAVGLRFRYTLVRGGRPVEDDPDARLDTVDGEVIDLRVQVIPFGPDGSSSIFSYLGDDPAGALTPEMIRELTYRAFHHLTPRRTRHSGAVRE